MDRARRSRARCPGPDRELLVRASASGLAHLPRRSVERPPRQAPAADPGDLLSRTLPLLAPDPTGTGAVPVNRAKASLSRNRWTPAVSPMITAAEAHRSRGSPKGSARGLERAWGAWPRVR